MSDRSSPSAARYLPQVMLVTAVVVVVPLAVVWALRAQGVIGSPWVGVALAVVLSLAAAVAGNSYWSGHRSSGDLMFSELFLWGWLRRLYVERQLASAVRLLGPSLAAADRDDQARVERKAKLLTQLALALEAQDPYTDGHSRRVARHSTMIAHKMGLSAERSATIRAAAAVHDVGKLHVPSAVLNKPGRLTAAEFEVVKRHVEVGATMVACLEDDELTAIVRHHHERLDGSGYPSCLVGEQIPLGAQIVAVADTYDAITAARPYRPARPQKQAFKTLAEESGTHLDPAVVRAFLGCYSTKRGLAFSAALAVLLERMVLWPRTGRIVRLRLSPRDLAATTVSSVVVAAAALAASIGSSNHGHRPLTVSEAKPLAVVLNPHVQSARPNVLRRTARRRANLPSASVVRSAPLAFHHAANTPIAPSGHGGGSPAGRARPVSPSPRSPSAPPTNPPKPHSTTTTSGPPATTTTATPPPTTTTTGSGGGPLNKSQCMDRGYSAYGFSNQGRCVAFTEHGSSHPR